MYDKFRYRSMFAKRKRTRLYTHSFFLLYLMRVPTNTVYKRPIGQSQACNADKT